MMFGGAAVEDEIFIMPVQSDLYDGQVFGHVKFGNKFGSLLGSTPKETQIRGPGTLSTRDFV
jgi:hypothetical protein